MSFHVLVVYSYLLLVVVFHYMIILLFYFPVNDICIFSIFDYNE